MQKNNSSTKFKHLLTITNQDFDLQTDSNEQYKTRNSVRGIILDENGKIALLNLKDGEYYMIPGGGIEEGESPTQALKREIKEEVGVNIKNIIPLGYIEEKRGVVVMKDIGDKFGKYLKSFGFIAEVEGKKGEQQLEEDELKEKMKVERLDFEKVENILKNYSVNNNIGKFVKKRDLRFLEEAKKYIK